MDFVTNSFAGCKRIYRQTHIFVVYYCQNLEKGSNIIFSEVAKTMKLKENKGLCKVDSFKTRYDRYEKMASRIKDTDPDIDEPFVKEESTT